MLPRYTFFEGEPCPHGLQDCLCDVVLDGRGETPVRTDTPHMFHQMALNELGDDTVSERNIIEFFSIVLGAHMLWGEADAIQPDLAYPGPEGYDPDMDVWTPPTHQFTSDIWAGMDPRIPALMRAHWRVGTPWRIAAMELPDGLDPQQLSDIRRNYRDNRNKERWARRKKGDTRHRVGGAARTTEQNQAIMAKVRAKKVSA